MTPRFRRRREAKQNSPAIVMLKRLQSFEGVVIGSNIISHDVQEIDIARVRAAKKLTTRRSPGCAGACP